MPMGRDLNVNHSRYSSRPLIKPLYCGCWLKRRNQSLSGEEQRRWPVGGCGERLPLSAALPSVDLDKSWRCVGVSPCRWSAGRTGNLVLRQVEGSTAQSRLSDERRSMEPIKEPLGAQNLYKGRIDPVTCSLRYNYIFYYYYIFFYYYCIFLFFMLLW